MRQCPQESLKWEFEIDGNYFYKLENYLIIFTNIFDSIPG
jgi:hypothetical protein